MLPRSIRIIAVCAVLASLALTTLAYSEEVTLFSLPLGGKCKPAPCPTPQTLPTPAPTPSTVTQPRAPELEGTTRSPEQTEAPQSTDPGGSNLTGELASAVGGTSVAVSANMFGDIFAKRSLGLVINLPPILVPGTPAITTTTPTTTTTPVITRDSFGRPVVTFVTTVTNVTNVTPATPSILIPQTPQSILLVPNPSGGGIVGRTKISEDNNPLPRDRVIFNYDYFNSVPMGTNDVNVNRICMGFEKTLLDQRASVEVRVPFATTLNSDQVAGGISNASKVEFGDLHLTMKALFYSGESLHLAGGLGIDLPTADDTKTSLQDGTPLVRVHNESVILTPFIAGLYTPTPRFFAQAWFQAGFDPNGSRLDANTDLTGLQGIGRLTEQTLLQTDLQLGYWLYRSGSYSQPLRGLAPFIELHYNQGVGSLDQINTGLFAINSTGGTLRELNLTAGVVTQIRDNCNLTIGAVAPLLQGENQRSFDYQLGLRLNIFFGPTARNRSVLTQVSGF